MTPTTTTTNTAPAAQPLGFAPPAHIVSAILKGIDAGRPDLAVKAFTKAGLEIDTFVDTDVPADNEQPPRLEGAGPIRIVSITGLKKHGCLDLLLALPANHFAAVDGAELALRILASGKPLRDMSAFTVETPSGLEMTLFGGVDRSVVGAPTDFIIGWNIDAPPARPISSALH